jgi:glyoxylase-like metal-dependent hydrolase (beta-lactamase superfamily II)
MAELEIEEVASGIWSVRRGRRWHRAYIVKTSPGAILIDTGPEPSGASVMQAFQRARVGLRSVRAILLTSGDASAAGGAPVLRERCGTRVLSSREEARRLFPFEVDGQLEVGDVVEERFEVLKPPEASTEAAGRLAFLFRPSGALFVGDGIVLNADRRR